MSTVENELISIERAILYKMHDQFAIKKNTSKMLECMVRKEDQGLKKVPFGCPAGQLDFLAGRETLEGHLHRSPIANGQGESYHCN